MPPRAPAEITRVHSVSVLFDFLKRGRTHSYGGDRSQVADLHLPRGPGPHPVVVLVHGGSWGRRYGRIVMRGLAGDLLRGGWAVWNIEYRRIGNGGGWPETFEDVAAAIDLLAAINAPIDLDRVSLVGHSAGGHLALWAASRPSLPSGAPGAISGSPCAFSVSSRRPACATWPAAMRCGTAGPSGP
jgi:acetyl esterase/lipase